MDSGLYLSHSGTPQMFDNDPHGSGRYRQGTGKNPHQHDDSLKALVNKFRQNGLKDAEIAKMLLGEHATAGDLKAKLTIEGLREREANRQKAMELYEKYGSASEVARIMYGDARKESSVRSLLR